MFKVSKGNSKLSQNEFKPPKAEYTRSNSSDRWLATPSMRRSEKCIGMNSQKRSNKLKELLEQSAVESLNNIYDTHFLISLFPEEEHEQKAERLNYGNSMLKNLSKNELEMAAQSPRETVTIEFKTTRNNKSSFKSNVSAILILHRNTNLSCLG
jgi:hypothetical protein